MAAHIFSHFSSGTILKQDTNYIAYALKTEDGEGIASVYPVLPGIEVIELDLHTSSFLPLIHGTNDILEINHCQEGRIECQMKDGCLQYVGEGDLFLNTLHNHSCHIALPLRNYRGMVISIDCMIAGESLAERLPEIPLNIPDLIKRFFAEDECFLIQANEHMKHLFSGMYTVSQEAKKAYFQLKVLELLIYLHYFDPHKEKQKHVFARQQVDIVKQIQKRMTTELSYRFTIEELAREYCISATALKSNFKGVYGTSIAAYMKNYRIKQATSLLRDTDMGIGEIAFAMGYESQSKFGAAFKDITKMTPMEYRKYSVMKVTLPIDS